MPWVSAVSASTVNTTAAPLAVRDPDAEDEDEDPLAVIIKRQCSRELHDLGHCRAALLDPLERAPGASVLAAVDGGGHGGASDQEISGEMQCVSFKRN